jgi:transcriptional regulator with XRE-family HTH domain
MKEDFKETEIIEYIRKLLNYRAKRAKLEEASHDIEKYQDRKENSAKELGLRISYLRKSMGLKQKEIAEAMGIQPSIISQVESGKLRLGRSRLEKLAQIFKVPYETLAHEPNLSDVHMSRIRKYSALLKAKKPTTRLDIINELIDAEYEKLMEAEAYMTDTE